MTRVKTHFSQNLSANFFKLESYLVIKNGKKQEVRNNLKMTVLNINKPYDSFNFTVFKRKFTA